MDCSKVSYYKKGRKLQQETILPSRIFKDYIAPFLVGILLGIALVLVVCREQEWEIDDVQLAPVPQPQLDSRSRALMRAGVTLKKLSAASECPNRPIQLLILVLSAPSTSMRRMAVRGTWMRNFRARHVMATTKFLLGTSHLGSAALSALEEEQNTYNDIIMFEDLKDSYANLSSKVLMGFKWSISDKVEYDYLLKTDDDSFVRIEPLSRAIKDMDCPRRLYWGYFMGYAYPEPNGKWKERHWFKCPHYLPYAMGGGYVLSRDVVDILVTLSHKLALYKNEDVTVGSWLAPFNLQRKHDLRFNTESVSHGCNNGYIVSHKEKVRSFYDKHTSLLKNRTLCMEEKEIRPSYVYNWTVSPLECCTRIKGLPVG